MAELLMFLVLLAAHRYDAKGSAQGVERRNQGEVLTNPATESHERFWRGEGPCLILISPSQGPLYDLEDYPTRFRDPEAMWQAERVRAPTRRTPSLSDFDV